MWRVAFEATFGLHDWFAPSQNFSRQHWTNDATDKTTNRVFSCRRFLIRLGSSVAALIRLCGLLASVNVDKFMQNFVYEVIMAC